MSEPMKASKFFSGNYVKAADLPRPVDVVIAKVLEEKVEDRDSGREEPKMVVYFQGKERGLILNKTNADTLTAMAGSDESDSWIGLPIQLFNDLSVANPKTGQRGGVRIRPSSAPQVATTPASRPAAPTQAAFAQPAFVPPAPPPATAEDWAGPAVDVPF